MALLSTPKHAMGEADLLAQIALSKTLLAEVPYSDRVTVTPHTPEQIVAHGEEIAMLSRTAASARRRAQRRRRHRGAAELLPQQRAAPVHRVGVDRVLLPAQPAHVARDSVLRLGRAMYPFLQAELFLPWDEDGFAERIDRTIDVFIREGLLQQVSDDDGGILARNAGQSDEVFRLRAIGHSLQQAFERYYIAISVLVKNGPGTLGAGELESLCQLAAQRLSLLYAPAAPEFFDKTLFRGFIQKLRELRWCGPTRTASWCSTSAWTLGEGRQGHPRPRAAAHDREDQPGSGRSRGRRGAGDAGRRRSTRQAGSSGISADSSRAMQSFSCSLRFFRRLTASSSASMSACRRSIAASRSRCSSLKLDQALGDAGEFDGIGRLVHAASLTRARRQRHDRHARR